MKECCKNCMLSLHVKKCDYTKGGCKDSDMQGFVCLGFAHEGLACWMVGVDPEVEICEMYSPPKVKENETSLKEDSHDCHETCRHASRCSTVKKDFDPASCDKYDYYEHLEGDKE